METGVVKFFNDEKGFGFIIDDKTGKDMFVQISGTLDEIQEEDRVTFNIGEGKKGPIAVDVKVAQ